MFKKFATLMIGFTCVTANAVPNSWGHGYNFGQAQFYIENENSQSLEISCGEDYGRAIYFSYHLDDEPIDINTKNQFSFLFDDAIPVMITSTKESDNEWIKFNEAIATARKIRVFRNNQEIAVFTPLPNTIKTEISHIKDECKNLDDF